MSIRIVVATALVLGAFGIGPNGALAETQEDREACTPDVHQHCGQFIPDREAIIQSLKQKIRHLSPGCRKVMSRPYPKDARN